MVVGADGNVASAAAIEAGVDRKFEQALVEENAKVEEGERKRKLQREKATASEEKASEEASSSSGRHMRRDSKPDVALSFTERRDSKPDVALSFVQTAMEVDAS